MKCANCRVLLDFNIQYERSGLIYCRDCAIEIDTLRRQNEVLVNE
ncbi:MAG: hypothetical protein WC307_06100 [Candidatus Nanoarchaeia archaeon]|jgi:hypothetical protein